jgi:hypothetical protein
MKDSCSEEDLEVSRLRNQIRKGTYMHAKKKKQRTVRTSTKKILDSRERNQIKTEWSWSKKQRKREWIRSRPMRSRENN